MGELKSGARKVEGRGQGRGALPQVRGARRYNPRKNFWQLICCTRVLAPILWLTLWLPNKIFCNCHLAPNKLVKWHRYPGVLLVLYLQNGDFIRRTGWNATCQMAPLSGCPALHTGSLSKNRNKTKISDNIYGFAINRIYKKNSTICISRFFCEGQGRREIIFRMWKQKQLPVIAGKKQCAMPLIAAAFVAAKEVFKDVLLYLVCINFRICGISIDPGHPGDVFDVGYVPFERSPKAANCRCRQPRNNSCDRADVNRRKSWWYTWYLRNFDRPLGLSGRRWQCFWRRQRVISSKNDGASPW